MNEYRARLSENGRIIIPAALRSQLHLVPGEELILRAENQELHIISLKQSLKNAQQEIRKYAKNKSLVKELKIMRRKEADHE